MSHGYLFPSRILFYKTFQKIMNLSNSSKKTTKKFGAAGFYLGFLYVGVISKVVKIADDTYLLKNPGAHSLNQLAPGFFCRADATRKYHSGEALFDCYGLNCYTLSFIKALMYQSHFIE